ncbi:MAG: ATP-binding protein, partial [Actinomycetota bacterium]
NAVDHGFPEGSEGGSVLVVLDAGEDSSLRVNVIDNGQGLSPDFEIAKATGLGLSIVRTLVTTELAGTIQVRPAVKSDSNKEVSIATDGRGTVVELKIPTARV